MTGCNTHIVAALIAAVVTAPTLARDVVVDVTASGSDAKIVYVNPAVAPRFSIDVVIDTADIFIISAEMQLRASDAGVVVITDGSYGPVWDSGAAFLIPIGPVAPYSGKFGGLSVESSVAGVSRLVTLELTVPQAALPGVHRLNVAEMFIGGLDFQVLDPPPVPGTDFEVAVVASGDTDFDQDRDLYDFADFSDCMAGPGFTPEPIGAITVAHCLAAFDLNSDGDVDAGDLAKFQESFTGTNP